jgi:ABC-type multidrug transport system fused ATPase/permease subunit
VTNSDAAISSPPPNAPIPSGRVFLRLLKLLRPFYWQIALALLLLALSSPCDLFPAFVWKFVTDDVVLGHHTSSFLAAWFTFGGRITGRLAVLLASVGWLFLVYLLGEVMGTLETWILNRAAQDFIFGFRNVVYGKLQSQSLAYLQRQRTGDLMSRAMGDVDELQSFIVQGIDVIIGEGLLWCGTVFIVFLVDWRVASASLAPLIIVYFLLRRFNARVRPIYASVRQRLGDVSTRLQENLSGVVVIKIFGREKQEAQRFHDATEAHYRQQIKALNARSLFFPATRVIGFFSNVFMIGVGGYYMITDGSFTPGDLVMFRAYWWRLFGPIQTLARVNDMVQRASAAARRIFEVLDAPDELPDSPGAVPLPELKGAKIKGDIHLKNVSFAYDSLLSSAQQPRGVLHDISLDIVPGQTVALCGPSGSGKTTILSLLLRFYDPVSGRVTLDGVDLRSIERDSLRRHFALVQQETFLFNDSILDNIRYGHGEATMDQVIAAAKAANAHGFITSFANAYETKVGERGVRLSGGQKQRISIARAFLADPAILLLDEPTSSVEPDAETAIVAALDRLMVGRTTVLTSHRPSLVNQADIVYVIEDGRVTASGSPDELRARGGWFARFVGATELDAEPAT